MDRIDCLILRELQRDGRLSNVDLAQRIHLSESATLRRVRALEEAGLINRYVALLNAQKVGFATNVFVSITLHRQDQKDLQAFEEAVKRVPEVMECYLMTGEFDYLLRVVVPDIAGYDAVYKRLIERIELADVTSSFSMEEMKHTTALPLDYA